MAHPTQSNLYRSTPTKLGTVAQLVTLSPVRYPVSRGVDNTLQSAYESISVMCWNLCDFGSGFNSWDPLPDNGFEGSGERFDAWRQRHLDLDSEKKGKDRGASDSDSEEELNWSAWLRLVDLANHIVEANADITVLIEVMTRAKGNREEVKLHNRVIWEKAVSLAEAFGVSKDLIDTMRDFLSVFDSGVTEVHIQAYRKGQIELLEEAEEYQEEVGLLTDLARKDVCDKIYWAHEIAAANSLAKDAGLSYAKKKEAGKTDTTADNSIMDLKAVINDEDAWIVEWLVSLKSRAMKYKNAENLRRQKGSSDLPVQHKLGLSMIESLNKILDVLHKENKWSFTSAQESGGETIAICTRNGWGLSGPVSTKTVVDRRPLYSFAVKKAENQIYIHAAHAPAPNHLSRNAKKPSQSWYETIKNYLTEVREKDASSRLHILCGDFNLDKNLVKAQLIQKKFFSDMYPPLATHEDFKSSFKAGPRKKAARKKISSDVHMNAAYDKVLMVGNPSVGAACALMMVADTWNTFQAGRRYSDHAWVRGDFLYTMKMDEPTNNGYGDWVKANLPSKK